jgi:hypothetical protein
MYINSLIINVFKYLLYGIIIALIINIIPKEKLPLSDNIIMILIMISTFILLDFICPKKELFTNDNKIINNNNSCRCKTNLNEHFNDPDIDNQPEDILNEETNERGVVRQEPIQKEETTVSQPVVSQPDVSQPDVSQPDSNQIKDIDIVDENIYSDYIMKPLGEYTNDFTNQWKYGWTFLNTDKWTVPMNRPPICVMPGGTESTFQPRSYSNTADLLEWNYARKITQPIDMNTAYIKNVLNQQQTLPQT